MAVDRNFLGTIADIAEERIQLALRTHLGKYIVERNITPTIEIVNSPAEVVISLMRVAHRVKPDFLGFWNISGDAEHMLKALEDANVDPADVFSDPSVPKEYRFYKWIKDDLYKQKANGNKTPKHVSDLWHKFIAPASFQMICLMAVHRAVRGRDQLRSSYKLDSVLHDYIDVGKLKFNGIAEDLTDLAWHKEMQRYHKIEYIVYMAFDGLSEELLDEKTQDISISTRPLLGFSELTRMKSNPGKLADDMHFNVLPKGKVIGSTGPDMSTPLDSFTYDVNGWVLTLSSDLVYDIGLNLINEHKNVKTNISAFVFDVDVASAYPTTEITNNVGKTTCQIETCGIKGLSVKESRAFGINLTNVKGNCLQLARDAYGFPHLDVLLEKFLASEHVM